MAGGEAMEVCLPDLGPQLLPFQTLFFQDVFEHDQLTVMARGLGLDTIIHNLLKLHCDPATLVLVINLSTDEQAAYISQLSISNVPLPGRALTSETTTQERADIYLEAGVLFVTSRILIVDMLTKVLPIHLVTGIVVCHAHNVLPLSSEVSNSSYVSLVKPWLSQSFLALLSDRLLFCGCFGMPT